MTNYNSQQKAIQDYYKSVSAAFMKEFKQCMYASDVVNKTNPFQIIFRSIIRYAVAVVDTVDHNEVNLNSVMAKIIETIHLDQEIDIVIAQYKASKN
jgi:hypothetical protein